MVRVYLAEFPYTKGEPKEQSKWARILLRQALEEEGLRLEDPVPLQRDVYGKPFLLEHSDIQINLSHSKGYVACAIGEKPVGIDVECWRGRRGRERVVKKFHPLEQEAYWAAEEGERERLFYELWVLKESFLKADGRGLLIPLASFYMEGICREQGRVMQQERAENYYYKQYRMEGRSFSLAVCSMEACFAEKPVFLELMHECSHDDECS